VLAAFGESRSAETALDTSAAARSEQTLVDHLDWTGRAAAAIVARLGLDIAIRDAVVLAARWHDQGKDRQSWQRAVGNSAPSAIGSRSVLWPRAGTGVSTTASARDIGMSSAR
jgi:CRISPR-associated endonuclease/helicase Cas3